jgi:hypothetical protein
VVEHVREGHVPTCHRRLDERLLAVLPLVDVALLFMVVGLGLVVEPVYRSALLAAVGLERV